VTPSRYRKKPVEIEAVQVAYENRMEVAEWCGGACPPASPSGTVYAPGLMSIQTLEGDLWASTGDWVIRGVAGEFYPCKPDIFDQTYEPCASGQHVMNCVAPSAASHGPRGSSASSASGVDTRHDRHPG
jgi:hypothetical protein